MSKLGPTPKKINWEVFERLCSYQCTQIEIAAFFNCSVDTLERACLRELGESLADVWLKRRFTGKVRLRKAQFEIIEKGGSGATAMAIYLDKKMFPDERPDLQPTTPTADVAAIGSGHKTFDQFCATAGYFQPYEKQKEMRAFGFDETEVRLLLGARGYGKTDFVTIMGTAYDLYIHFVTGQDMSERTKLIITKSKSRNAAIVEEIKNSLEKNGVPLDKANTTIIRVKGLIGQDHSVEAITIKTSMRGRHPKQIIMDDPVTDEDTSEAMRLLVKKKYDEAFKLCQNILIIGQPAHFDDLYATLRDTIKTMSVPHGSIPELDADLKAMQLAGVDVASIEMSYHLRVPKDGSAIFSNIKFVDHFPSGESVAFLDPSDGKDYSAVSIVKGYMDGVAVTGKAWKKAWYHCLDELAEFLVANGVRRLCFETNKHGEQPIEQLRVILEPFKIGVVGKFSTTNKHATIQAAGSYAHMIHLAKDSDKRYADLVTKYEYGAKYDDPPDSLARCLQWLGLLKDDKK